MTAATGTAERPTLSERQALILVGTAHVVLLAALSLALRSVTPPTPPAEAVAVEVVSASEAAAPPPPPAAPPPPAPPPPTPTPEPIPTPELKPPVEQPPDVPVEKPKVEKPTPPQPEKPKPEKPKPEKPKPEKPKPAPKLLDASALESQLDKALPKPKAKPLDTAALSKSLDAALPKSAPHAAHATATTTLHGDPRAAAAIAAAIRAQVTPCWNLPVGAATAGKVTALLHIDINRDGSIAGRPGLVSQTGVTGTNADYARAFAETARRAVLRCSPLKLPADQYDQWKAVEINFDPTNM